MGNGRCSQAPATRALPCFLPHVGAVFRRLFPLSYVFRQRPYRVEYTGSLPNSAVKRRRARLVLGWGTAWESLGVLLAFFWIQSSQWGPLGLLWRNLHVADALDNYTLYRTPEAACSGQRPDPYRGCAPRQTGGLPSIFLMGIAAFTSLTNRSFAFY